MFEEILFENIRDSWKDFFVLQKKQAYFNELLQNLEKEYKNYICYPKLVDIFRLFKIIDVNSIRTVIFGQDPYHNEKQANGIAFSVNENIKIPPSLRNIFSELKNDLNIDKDSGNLFSWVNQGVFLYNTLLSVRKNEPNSHKNIGWFIFTKNLLNYINEKNPKIVYVFWGKQAQKFQKYVLSNKVIISAHPSPFSYKYFKDTKPFSKINKILIENNIDPIKW